jgi:hypothetical protein
MQLSNLKSRLEYQPDRRWQPCFHVNGAAVLDTGHNRYPLRPVEMGLGGIRLQADEVPPLHSTGKLQLDVYGYGEMIYTSVSVIRSDENSVTAIFVSPQPTLARCISWLTSWSQKARNRALAAVR